MDISLIIATYNRGEAIAPTLRSVDAQTRSPDEVIVVDDGSTDGTADWVASHFPRVRVAPKPNGGTSSARNFGAVAAHGQILVFLDHDDLLHPDAVETLAGLLERYPDVAAAHCDHVYENRTSGVRHPNHHHEIAAFRRLLETPHVEPALGERVYGRPLYRALLWGNLLQQPWAVRASAFQQLGGFSEDIRYCEDWDIYLRVTERFPVVVSDRVISTHVIAGENLHLADSKKQEVMYERVLRRRLASHRRSDWAENAIVRKKLAMQQKAEADSLRTVGQLDAAWRGYARSTSWWPLDHVVAARMLLLSLPAWRERRGANDRRPEGDG